MIDPKVYDFKPKVDFFKIEWDEKKSGYEIFPDFYDADRQNWLALNCELCSKAAKTDFAKLFRA